MVCYASLGGSGVVATELARALAARGHDVHLISSDPPFRWQEGLPRLTLHKVTTPSYPLFREPQYLLALANAIAHIADRERLDIVHAHYAVPHATAAYLADQMMTSAHTAFRPRMVTTLHGTDITLIGADASVLLGGGLLDRAFTRRDRGVREPAPRHRRARWRPARHRRDSELPRLRSLPPALRSRAAPGHVPAGHRRVDRAHVELPSGQAGRYGCRGIPPRTGRMYAPGCC